MITDEMLIDILKRNISAVIAVSRDRRLTTTQYRDLIKLMEAATRLLRQHSLTPKDY